MDAVDALLIVQLETQLISSITCPEMADVNGDGMVDTVDALLILQLISGMIDSLPATSSSLSATTLATLLGPVSAMLMLGVWRGRRNDER